MKTTTENNTSMQQPIPYAKIMALGFFEQFEQDEIYFNEFGFQYSIISMELTPEIHLDYEKETRLCFIYRSKNVNGENFTVNKKPVNNLETLIEIIDFFKNEKEK
ncbi:MAG: hypothetical protein LT105_15055 [Lentimicrobium sp.]|nr:hypothetical protein [Lentimicrobium sp.]